MEPVFEIQYFCDYRTLAEFYRKHGTGPRYVTVALMVCFVIGITMYSWVMGVLHEVEGTLWMLTIIYAVFFMLPHITTWGNLRGTKKNNDGKIPVTRVCVGETIEMFEGMVHITVEYKKIRRVVRLKHSYVLMLGKRNGVILKPDGFTKGTFEEFKQFLREKRPDLTIPE